LTIADFGCSHGKNSMSVINQMFDQLNSSRPTLAKNLKEIIIYHNDLPDNDFKEVLKCAEDTNLGYKEHGLVKSNQVEIDTRCIGKSYYESIVSNSTVDFAFCYISLHWMPEYCDLDYGLIYNDEFNDSKLEQYFGDVSYKYLLKWLNLRYEELKPSGVLNFNILRTHKLSIMINKAWDNYLKLKNIQQAELSKVKIPMYDRSEEQISKALGAVKYKFRTIDQFYIEFDSVIDKPTFKSVFYNQFLSGLSNYPKLFPNLQSINNFYEGFEEEFFKSSDQTTYLTGWTWILLQKI
jgi:hypothetical protein